MKDERLMLSEIHKGANSFRIPENCALVSASINIHPIHFQIEKISGEEWMKLDHSIRGIPRYYIRDIENNFHIWPMADETYTLVLFLNELNEYAT